MNDKEMLELMTTCYERDTKLFKAKIAELEAENECLVASCKATVNCKADAIREFIELYAKASVMVHSNHSVKFYGDKYIADNLEGKSDESVTRRI